MKSVSSDLCADSSFFRTGVGDIDLVGASLTSAFLRMVLLARPTPNGYCTLL